MKTEVEDLRGQIDHLTKAKVCNKITVDLH